MRSLGTRRVALAAGAAMAAVIALSGCSAGQVAETAILESPISGLNTQSPGGALLIRNLQVPYNNPTGYPANGTAPLQVSLFNQTEQPLTVTITSKPQTNVVPEVVSAMQVGVGAPPSSSGASAAPSTPALQPAKFTIPALGSQVFNPEGGPTTLLAQGLSNALKPGYSLALTFQVENGPAFEAMAPFAIPTSPASRAPGIEGENTEQ
ncbi:hypothetical protein ODJ79_26325 [Actinoplanes sp. KI2]|uniref:hypothetical protein n=1 Tax=Actinoplanes sp. KI2 TaxID=2983315 RepID=UPI0021D58785|nr:hypothetical protein [Actinoplanes sp. KI2]MCU7727261.1 hypothetical protein [Actinoplanes sp. KI2]